MLELLVGIIIGVYIGQTFNVPNVQALILYMIKQLEQYKKSDNDKT